MTFWDGVLIELAAVVAGVLCAGVLIYVYERLAHET